MAKMDKVAITLDHRVLSAVERLRRQTGESRSALINRVLRLFVGDETRRARVERYVQAYREQPETQEEVAAVDQVAAEGLADVPWE